jgi:hypothetical protein
MLFPYCNKGIAHHLLNEQILVSMGLQNISRRAVLKPVAK